MSGLISDILGLFKPKDEFPDATKLKWVVGRGCKGCTICEPLARRDLHGLGPGVYPKESFPRRHWGCSCTKTPVD